MICDINVTAADILNSAVSSAYFAASKQTKCIDTSISAVSLPTSLVLISLLVD